MRETTPLATRSAYRIALAGIAHETHSFASPKTTLDDFRDQALFYGEDIITKLDGTKSAAAGMIDGADPSWQLLPTIYAGAMPGGIVATDAFDLLVDDLKQRLIAALPLDGVLLALHGAMVTENELDAESAILNAVREIVGSDVPIVCTLDMHGNISPRMLSLADMLIAFDKNPHTDPYERGQEAVTMLSQLLVGELKLSAGYMHPPLMLAPQATGTDDLPLSAVHRRRREMEAEDDVILVSVFGGFAYSDTASAGVSLIVYTDNNSVKAQRYANELADILMANRDAALPDMRSPGDAVEQALSMPGGPIILVDSADNIGGGTPGDGTDALRAMIAADVVEGVVIIADPEAVALCSESGMGAELTLIIGGKIDEWHGQPISVTGTVEALSTGTFQVELANNHFASFFGNVIHMGRCAWFRAGESGGVNILLTERKMPPFDLAQLRHIGIVPEEQKMIAVKSAVAYRAAYMPIASGVVEMDTAGLCSANLNRFPYQHIRRPILPLDK